MNCKEFEQLKDQYLQGEVTTAAEQAIEAHLESCATCRQTLDRIMSDSETQKDLPGDKGVEDVAPFESGLDEKKQRRILRWAKYKNRFSIAVFLLLLFSGLNIVGVFLSSYYFNRGQEESRIYKTQRTAALLTEFTFPNVTLPMSVRPMSTFTSMAGWGHSSLEIKPYFAAKGNYVLQKQVGKEKVVIGQLNINHFFSSIFTQWQWANDVHREYLYFYHPAQLDAPERALSTGETATGESPIAHLGGTWETLDILPEGTVAELSFSFRQTYSIDEIMEMLDAYDLEVTWYAIATGQEDRRNRNPQEPLSAFNGVWGMPHFSRNMLSHGETVYNIYNETATQGLSVAESSLLQVSESDLSNYRTALEDYFMDSMQHLVQNEKISRKLYRGNPNDLRLGERYEYIQENGIHIYGVVVTGPTKELFKLKELETIHSPALGEIKLWNWFHRSFQGTLY